MSETKVFFCQVDYMGIEQMVKNINNFIRGKIDAEVLFHNATKTTRDGEEEAYLIATAKT